MKKIIYLICLVCLIIEGKLLEAEEPIKLTLDEAIGIALRDNREVLLKKEDLNKAKEKWKEAEAERLPKFSLESSRLDMLDYYNKDITSISNQLSLKQFLYTGGKISGNIKKSVYGMEINKARLEETILEIVFNVKKAFFTLLLAEEYAKLNKAIFTNTQNHLKAITQRYHNGQASESEVVKLQQALANVEQVLLLSLNQIESAKANLRNLLYLEKDIDIEAEGELIYEPMEIAFDEVYLKALRERPILQLYETQEKIDKLQKEIAKSELLPTVYASWDYYTNYSNSPQAISKGWENHQTIGIVLSWPIFDGFATQAKIRQAEIDLKETQLLKEKTTMDIASELKNAYLEINDAMAKLKAKDAEINFYEDNFRVINDKYNRGIASDLDLEDAKLSLEIARFNRKEAVYDYLIAKAKLEKITGEME